MECHFCVDIYAPRGLRGIADAISQCKLPLYAWKSGYNGKVILRSESVDWLEWNMDSSDDDTMFVSGDIKANEKQAKHLLQSLSQCLADAGFPHCILLDDLDEQLYARIEHLWQPEHAP